MRSVKNYVVGRGLMMKQDQENCFYVVGVGASAGGLEALQEFFEQMPGETGAAFIVVQHLSPDYKSLMSELLARHTEMEVSVALDDEPVLPNHVYLIPPKKELTIRERKLRLVDQHNMNGVNLAIDTFFKSLAEDCKEYAIGIVLSGAGSDGAVGIRYIKESGGMIMAQKPESAGFNSMPLSSIGTGLVDFVLAPEEMPAALISYIEHPFAKKVEMKHELSYTDKNLKNILLILKDYKHMDFTNYKENTIIRRLERRVSINQFLNLEEYYHFLKESDQEKECLFKELLIGVTGFFRDSEAFDFLEHSVIPNLKPVNNTIRIWSIACSTGEEVYSVAMLLAEYMEQHDLHYDVKIFATDIDKTALNTASQGFYAEGVVSDIRPEYLEKYFIQQQNGYHIAPEIRKMIIFSEHNVLNDPPFSRLNLIICRNLFIYLKASVQQELLYRFYYALNPEAYLFMGSSESIGEMNESFKVISRKWKFYQQINETRPVYSSLTANNDLSGNYISHMLNSGGRSLENRGIKIEKIVEEAFTTMSPPSLIVNDSDNIIYMGNDINHILRFRSGVFSQNLFANLPNGLGLFVNGIIRRLRAGEHKVVQVCATDLPEFEGKSIVINGYSIVVSKQYFYLLTFTIESSKNEPLSIVDGHTEINDRIRELEDELRISKENLQATIEELETTNEELQSSNEELVAANEELQSTNEELQSVNEELYTVNSEYQSKIDELTRLNMDLDNLLINVEVGALYLDNTLKIRKVTPIVTRITNIMDVDVGRPISHLSLMDNYPNWVEDVQQVQKTLKSIDREIYEPDGTYWMIRIRPYRSEYHAVEGIIITFLESSDLRKMRSSSFEHSGKLYWQRENCDLMVWRYNLEKQELITQYDKNCNQEPLPFKIEDFLANVHPDDKLHVTSSIRECLNSHKMRCEVIYRYKNDDEYVWMYNEIFVVEMNTNGKAAVIQGVRTYLNDQ